MGVDRGLYQFVLVLHILAVIIGFGGVFIAGFYGMEAGKRRGPEGQAISEATMKVTSLVPTMAIYSVPILGILLILLSDDAWQFSDMWVSLSFLLYIAALVVAQGFHVPNLKKMVEMGRTGRPDPGEMAQRAKKAATLGGILNVLWVLVLILMVVKPGR